MMTPAESEKLTVREVINSCNYLLTKIELSPKAVLLSGFNDQISKGLKSFLDTLSFEYNNFEIFFNGQVVFTMKGDAKGSKLGFESAQKDIVESTNIVAYKLLVSLKLNDKNIAEVLEEISTLESKLSECHERYSYLTGRRTLILTNISEL